MTRRLLFDQNLAPRLVDRVAAEFPGSLHVRDLDLQAATDAEVLRVASERDLVVVTKDKDFADIVTARGDGPKVLWLMLGNVTTDQVAPNDPGGSRVHRSSPRRPIGPSRPNRE